MKGFSVFVTTIICCGCGLLNDNNNKVQEQDIQLPALETLEMQPQQVSTCQISGQLVDWRAKPLYDAIITFSTAQGDVAVTTDENGYYNAKITQGVLDTLSISIQSSLGQGNSQELFHLNGQEILNLDLMFNNNNLVEVLN